MAHACVRVVGALLWRTQARSRAPAEQASVGIRAALESPAHAVGFKLLQLLACAAAATTSSPCLSLRVSTSMRNVPAGSVRAQGRQYRAFSAAQCMCRTATPCAWGHAIPTRMHAPHDWSVQPPGHTGCHNPPSARCRTRVMMRLMSHGIVPPYSDRMCWYSGEAWSTSQSVAGGWVCCAWSARSAACSASMRRQPQEAAQPNRPRSPPLPSFAGAMAMRCPMPRHTGRPLDFRVGQRTPARTLAATASRQDVLCC
jgi:hypothetical protein